MGTLSRVCFSKLQAMKLTSNRNDVYVSGYVRSPHVYRWK